MKFSENLTWEAVEHVFPKIKEARTAGMHFNLPSMLEKAAVRYFLLADDSDFLTSYFARYCAYVVKTALLELNDVGYLTFGDVEREF